MEKTENAEATEQIKQVTLKEMLEVANKCMAGTMEDIEFRIFLSNLAIRTYIPIVEKVNRTMEIVHEIINLPHAMYELSIAEMYKKMFYKILLGSYALIDVSDIGLQTYENYDILFPLFSNYILEVCREDYKVFEDIIDRTLSVYNFNNLVDVMDSISEEGLQRAVKENQRTLEELQDSTDTIRELNKIFEYNDPTTKQIVEGLEVIGAAEAMKKEEPVKSAEAKRKPGRKKKEENK